MKVDIYTTQNKYEIIYADPAWSYNYLGDNFDKQFTKNKDGWSQGVMSAKDHYYTMNNDDIKALPVARIAADNCLFYCWVTNPLFAIGLEIIKAWGFEYKTIAFVWYKQATNPGFYTMSQCELCVVAKKGNIPTPRGTRNERQLISEKRGEHSTKPDEARIRIERMHPYQKKIELFARQQYKGWDAWGNQVSSRITQRYKQGVLI